MNRRVARIHLAVALATLAGATGACDKTDAGPTAVKPGEQAKPAELAKPDFTITARDLYAEFRPQIEAGNADGVRAKYTGKTVRISGDVKANVRGASAGAAGGCALRDSRPA